MTCSRENCDNEVRAWNAKMCKEHAGGCYVEDCDNTGVQGHIICAKHMARLKKYGVTTFDCTCPDSCKEHYGKNKSKKEPRWMRVPIDLFENGGDESKIPAKRLQLWKSYALKQGIAVPEAVAKEDAEKEKRLAGLRELYGEHYDFHVDEDGNVRPYDKDAFERHYKIGAYADAF